MKKVRSMKLIGRRLALVGVPCVLAFATTAETRAAEFRGFWADAFHVGFKSASQIDSMVSRAVTGNYNAIIAEVLAYHDTGASAHGAYWNSAIVPKASDISGGIDPLAYLVQQAHANGLEVHTWLVAYRVSTSWPPSGNATVTNRPQWIMVPRADMDGGPATVDGKYTFDPGSPDVQEYLISIVRELVTNYDIDGVHWDYIRYTNTDAGYPAHNWYTESGLARFKTITGYVGTPSTGYGPWNDFRRREVTELVRRTQAEIATIASNPQQPLRHTAALITWGDAPGSFTSTSAYALYQNWREWLEEGYLDAGIPMCYYREHNPPHDQWYRNWVDASLGWAYDRHVFIGPGIYLNTFANSITQMQYAQNAGADGLSTYSYATTRDNTTDWSWYSYVATNLFTGSASPPDMPWRDPATATRGTVYGRVTDGSTGAPIDDATIKLNGFPVVQTDGNGFYIVTQLPAGPSGTLVPLSAAFSGYADVQRPAVLVQRATFTEANFALGTWLPGDYDVDADVDIDDYQNLDACQTGPDGGPLAAGCDLFDFDDDDDVDLEDHRVFQESFSG
ncbi:MAG: family 10 glycosylhydrolase [bacterium]|nr:family 10 glycosylhydrolase [bacterium]